MPETLEVRGVTAVQRPVGTWAAALLHAVAREEAAGRRPERVTEPGLATWKRFRGRLTNPDLLDLLFEDEAVLHPIPFNPGALGEPLRAGSLPEEVVEPWLAALPDLDLAMPASTFSIR